MEVIFLLCLTLMVGLMSGTILTVAIKYDLHNLYELHRKPWMPPMCLFCAGFWIGWPLIWLILLLSGEPFHNLYWMAGFAAAPIARLVSNHN